MSEAVLVAIITGCISLIGTTMTVTAQNKKTNHKFEVQQAVMDTKIEELTREVRENNNVKLRTTANEAKLEMVELRIKMLEERMR